MTFDRRQVKSKWLLQGKGFSFSRWHLVDSFLLFLVSFATLASISIRTSGTELQSAASFSGIQDKSERSRALFVEAGRVLQSQRCLNCHPAGDRPSQGEFGALHVPKVVRGKDGTGAPGLRCATCHQEENFVPSGVPGGPNWHLAKASMAWRGKSLHQICLQIKNPKLNGSRTLDQIQEHLSKDRLVGWAWHPGSNREPAPGTQEAFGELIAQWIETGAECPK